MRKKTLIALILTLFMIISLMPGNVLTAMAEDEIEICQQDFQDALDNPGTSVKGIVYSQEKRSFGLTEGTYKLTGNIEDFIRPTNRSPYFFDLILDDNVILDLNEKEININRFMFCGDSVSIIKGNGTVCSWVEITDKSNVTIENGTFEKGIAIYDGSYGQSTGIDTKNTDAKLTINGGIIKGASSGVSAGKRNSDHQEGKVTVCINGGLIDGKSCSVECLSGMCYDLTINGGTFSNGLFLNDVLSDNCNATITAGFFSGGSSGKGAIFITHPSKIDKIRFNDILAEGYVYEPELIMKTSSSNDYYFFYSQNEISVKKGSTVPPNDNNNEVAKKVDMYRLYNPNSGEHFYTASAGEKDHLVSVGWNYEGIGWTAPEKSNTPVYRLYNPNAGDHHYTMNVGERNYLVSVGWNDEGIGWYSDDAQGVPLYRQYNPNAETGSHNYTTNKSENDWLVGLGWNAEGIGWYGIK